MQSKLRDLQGFLILIIALLGGGYLIMRNMRPLVSYNISGPTATPTSQESSWQDVIKTQLINGATRVPTRDIQVATFVPPTLPPVDGTAILVKSTQFYQAPTPTPRRDGPSTPTRPGPTAVPSPTSPFVVSVNNDVRAGQFSPPQEIAPLSLDPRDHFWFQRPVNADANSNQLQYYVYGSDGPQNVYRIHHGIDLPNPIGKPVHAAAAGRVIWAADNYRWTEDGITDAAYTYGNVIIIEHDFGYNGQRLYTLYAHLVQMLVVPNQRVEAGETIGLSGQSGVVSGPHVHFEVRVGKNNYGQTRNPLLWMAPFLNDGVIAGRVIFTDGKPVEDVTVALMYKGKIVDTTTTYVILKRPGVRVWTVNSDEVWKENYAFGDVPVGDYQVVVTFGGLKLSRDITVRPATTTLADTIQIPIIQSTPVEQPTTAP